MIEIYLATLLIGIGTIYQKSQAEKKVSVKSKDKSNLSLVKEIEQRTVEKFDSECKETLPRKFSGLSEDRSDNREQQKILKYVPKDSGKITSSLTGAEIDVEQFIQSETIGRPEAGDQITSNTWAVPYFRGTATQNMNVNGYKNKLDIHTGRSQFNFHKKETKNFFKPSKDLSFINGSPNVTTALEDRYVQSNNRTNELPFQQVKVARGVGTNYGNTGKGGFHQFEINELAKPKNVDELRVLSNPKVSYTEPVQAGKHIDKRSSQQAVSKNRPDKFYLNTKSRWNKTTGAFLKKTSDQKFINKPTNRTTSRQVVGAAAPAQIKNQTKRAAVKEADKNNYLTPKPHNPSLPGGWRIKNKSKKEGFQSNVEVDDDYDISSYGRSGLKLPPNERDTTQDKMIITNVVEAVKAIVSPLQDKMKRTKKQNIEGNPNIRGYVNMSIPNKQTAYDPNDIAKTTIRETTEDNKHEGNIKGATKLIVYDPNDVARTTIKETLIHDTREGNVNLERNKKQMDYSFANAKTTIKETTEDNKHNTNVAYNRGDGNGYLTNEFFAPSTLKQITSDNEYTGNNSASVNHKGGHLSNRYEAPATHKQFTSDNEYTGSANSYNKSAQSYDSMKNAITNPNKEIIAQGRAPTQEGAKVAGSQSEQGNVSVNKQNATIDYGNKANISVTSTKITGGDFENLVTKPRVSLSPKNQQDIYNPILMNQLNSNPYSLSINKIVNEDYSSDEEFGSL